MGEYEPDDSRDITQKDGHVPGEPPRTGPREGETRKKSESPNDPKPMPQEKQQAQQQGQQGGGQSQSQTQSQSAPSQPEADQSGLWGNDAPRTDGDPASKSGDSFANRDMQAQPDGPLAGNQPQAIDNPAGAASPTYDQYEVNQPQNMHQQSAEEERKVREQASLQKGEDLGFGYGADGSAEMHDAPDTSDKNSAAADSKTDAEVEEREAEKRGYGGDGEAEKKAYDQR